MQILEHILKNNKAGILATSWQPCEFGNQLANSSQSQLALRNSLTTLHCSFAKFASHIKFQKLSEISHCQLRNGVANFATALPISQMHCEIRNLANRLRTDCEFRNPIKIPTVLPSDFVLRITFPSELRFRRF